MSWKETDMARNIVQITVKRLMDEDPDTSYLGEFTDKSHIDRRYDEFVECIDYEVDEPINSLCQDECRYFDSYSMG
jgi:CRISPR/Cas system-associated exonuclease Cas4 (RecB family)